MGSQFTPQVIDLPAFLEALISHSGDREALKEAVWKPGVRIKVKDRPPSRRNRMLPLEAAVQYELLDKNHNATALTHTLSKLKGVRLYEAFATHILRHLGGLTVIYGIEDMRREPARPAIKGDSLARYLTTQKNFFVAEHNVAINSIRLWLSKAGVFAESSRAAGWIPNLEVVQRLVGLDTDTIGLLSSLEPHQIAFIKTICAIGERDEYLAATVRSLTETRYPEVSFDRGSLPNNVLKPLQDMGLLTYSSGGTKGGKSARFKLTKKFDVEVMQSFVTRTVKDLDPLAASYFRKAPRDIYRELKSKNKNKKGRALEALTIRLMRLLGLRFLAWNRRAQYTGHGEVDAVFAGVFGAVPTRWQIQCKNTLGQVRLEDVAKEVGLTPITNATHILYLATTNFTKDAQLYADQVMQNSALTLYLLGREDFDKLVANDSTLGKILRNQAERAIRLPASSSIFAWK